MEWTRGHVLGRGSSATVSTATSTSGHVFAVKSVGFSQSEILKKEQHIFSMLNSPYVVSYKGCDITREDNKMVYNIHIDYMSAGSIIDVINRRNGEGLTNLEVVNYTRDIVHGLEYIHSNGVVHCDIKGSNIMINESGVKIGDFGCAKSVGQAGPICGTPMFMAPEVARGEDQGFPADIWALGCTMIEMATGCLPWLNVNSPVSVLYKIAFSGDTPEIPDGLSDQAKDFINKCLIRDPRHRWTAKELLKHPYIRQFEDNSKQINCEKVSTNSPTSILDQDVWDSIEESSSFSSASSEFPQSNCLSNSFRQRITQLVGKSEMPNWRYENEENDWITIRMNEIEDGDDGKDISGAVIGGSVDDEMMVDCTMSGCEVNEYDDELYINLLDIIKVSCTPIVVKQVHGLNLCCLPCLICVHFSFISIFFLILRELQIGRG